MKKIGLFLTCLLSLMWILTANAEAVLIDIGNGMIYDTYQNVTWLEDANYALTSQTDPQGDMDGAMDFHNATTWAANLDFAGYTDWRLPDQPEIMNLGRWHSNISSDAPGPFMNVMPEWYWTTTQGDPGKRRLYHFEGTGVQTASESYSSGYVLPLRDGPTGDPQVFIKANGQENSLTVSQGTSVSITVGLYSGTALHQKADYWLVIATPFSPPDDVYSYVYPSWEQGMKPVFSSPGDVTNFLDAEILNMDLPAGVYTVYFGIDLTPDNTLTIDNTLYYNSISITVTDGGG
jgi:hypothetical protein